MKNFKEENKSSSPDDHSGLALASTFLSCIIKSQFVLCKVMGTISRLYSYQFYCFTEMYLSGRERPFKMGTETLNLILCSYEKQHRGHRTGRMSSQ